MPEKTTATKVADFARKVLHVQRAQQELPPEHVQAIKESMRLTRENEGGFADHYSEGGWHSPERRGGLTGEMAGVPQTGLSARIDNPTKHVDPQTPRTLNDTAAEQAIRIAKAQGSERGRIVNDVSAPEEYEFDDQNRVVKEPDRGPMTWSNAGERIGNAGGEWIRKNHPEWMQSDLQKDINDAKFKRTQNEVDMWAIPKAHAMRQAFAPADVAGHYIMDPDDKPKTREPVQMQREFSNDEEKAAYLERSGRGMKGSKQ